MLVSKIDSELLCDWLTFDAPSTVEDGTHAYPLTTGHITVDYHGIHQMSKMDVISQTIHLDAY